MAGITVHPPSRCNMKHNGKPTKGERKREGLADSTPGFPSPKLPHDQTSKRDRNIRPSPQRTRVFLYACVHAKSLQLCPTLCNSVDCSPPDSSVHGSLQARILEWVAMPSSRGSSRPRDQTPSPVSPVLAGSFFTTEPCGSSPPVWGPLSYHYPSNSMLANQKTA